MHVGTYVYMCGFGRSYTTAILNGCAEGRGRVSIVGWRATGCRFYRAGKAVACAWMWAQGLVTNSSLRLTVRRRDASVGAWKDAESIRRAAKHATYRGTHLPAHHWPYDVVSCVASTARPRPGGRSCVAQLELQRSLQVCLTCMSMFMGAAAAAAWWHPRKTAPNLEAVYYRVAVTVSRVMLLLGMRRGCLRHDVGASWQRDMEWRASPDALHVGERSISRSSVP